MAYAYNIIKSSYFQRPNFMKIILTIFLSDRQDEGMNFQTKEYSSSITNGLGRDHKYADSRRTYLTTYHYF